MICNGQIDDEAIPKPIQQSKLYVELEVPHTSIKNE
jgi:hypothetical protein